MLVAIKMEAQQQIFFINPKNPSKKLAVYKLPQHVTCTFKNGEKQSLVLEKVIGDTLIFEKMQYSKVNPTHQFHDIQKILFHKKGEEVLYTLTIGFAGLSAFSLVCFFVEAATFEATDGGGFPEHILLPPIALITGVISGLLYTTLPKYYTSSNYQIYIKTPKK
jgi:hypothetical protein